MSVNLKVTFQLGGVSQIRRFAVSDWEDFRSKIQQTAGVKSLSELILQYRDEESDMITFDSEAEFQSGVLARASSPALLRLTVSLRPKKANIPSSSSLSSLNFPRPAFLEPLLLKLAEHPHTANFLTQILHSVSSAKTNLQSLLRRASTSAGGLILPAGKFELVDGVKGRLCHYGVTCDGPTCNRSAWVGRRHKCRICDDVDLCGRCYETRQAELIGCGGHLFGEVPMRRVWGFRAGRYEGELIGEGPIFVSSRSQLEAEAEATETTDAESRPTIWSDSDSDSDSDSEEERSSGTCSGRFAVELDTLHGMGFYDDMTSLQLLEKHRGNLNFVVQCLVGE